MTDGPCLSGGDADGALGFSACRCSMPGPRIWMPRAGRAPCRGHKQSGDDKPIAEEPSW